MNVLLAIDGSEHSHAAVEEVASRDWPRGTAIQILTALHSGWPLLPDPSFILAAAHMEAMQDQERAVPAMLDDAAARIGANRSPDLLVTTAAVEGVPHEVILRVAEEWGADLIVLGSHGYGRAARAVLGSVAAAVFAEARCAVHIVRPGRPLATAGPVTTPLQAHAPSSQPLMRRQRANGRDMAFPLTLGMAAAAVIAGLAALYVESRRPDRE